MIQTPKFNSFETPKLKGLMFSQDNKTSKDGKDDRRASGIKINPANEKQWEETIKILIPSFSKILKKFCSVTYERFF